MTVDIKLVGDRPAGSVPFDSPAIQAAALGIQAVGLRNVSYTEGSNDANLAVNLGIPAVRLASGGQSGGTHSFNEWYRPQLAYLGPQASFLTILGLVGVENVSAPLLPRRPPRD